MADYKQLRQAGFSEDQIYKMTGQKPKQTRGRGGTLTSLIQEGGALGGATYGASLGSALGPLGTLAGAGIGGFLGSLGGGLTESKIRDDKYDLGSNLGEAGIDAILSAGPIKLAKAGKGALAARKAGVGLEQALLSGVEKNVAKQAAGKKVGSKLVNNSGTAMSEAGTILKTSLEGKAKTLGNKALASQYGTIGKNVARETSPLETISKLADYGITKPKDAEFIASSITGSSGVLSKAVAKAAEGSGPVQTRGLVGVMQKAITENGLVDKDAKSVRNVIQAQLKAIREGGNTPQAALKSIRNLEKRAANLQGKGGNYRLSTPERIDQANVLRSVKNEIEERLYKTAGANDNLPKVLTPKLRENLLALRPNNKAWQNFVDEQVMKSKDVRSLRSLQAPFVRVSKIIDEGDVNALTFGGRMTGGSGSLGSKLLDASTEVLRNPAARAVSKPLRSAEQSALVNRASQLKGPLGIAGRVGGYNALGAITQPTVDQSSGPNSTDQMYNANPMANSDTNMPMSSDMMSTQYQNQAGDPSTSATQPQDIGRQIQMLTAQAQIEVLQQGGSLKDAEQIGAMVPLLFQAQGIDISQYSSQGSGQKPLSDTAISTINDGTTALGLLDTIENTVLSNSQNGPIAGRLGRANPYNTSAQTFEAEAMQAAQLIGRFLEGGKLAEGDIARYRKLLPTITDTDATAQNKIASLRQLLSQNLQGFSNLQSQYGKRSDVSPEVLAEYGLQ